MSRLFLPLCLLLTACPASEVGTCATVAENAVALRQSFQACDSDTTCVVVAMADVIPDGGNVGAFQCFHAFPDDADLDALADEAVPYIDKHDTCGLVNSAKCNTPGTEPATCNLTTGLCEVPAE
jgi:hypothetical protein